MSDTLTRYGGIEYIKTHNHAIGHHFFTKGAMRFFNSRILPTVYGGRYFITSERFDHNSPRYYTIRECVAGHIETVGEFQEYATSGQAVTAIKRLLKEGN
jgi:hypothetical protein